MVERKMIEYKDNKILIVTLFGFYNYNEFEEVERILKDEINATLLDFSSGWEASRGYSIKDGIKLEWKFSNWDCIQLNYHNPKDEVSIKKVQEWANIIFNNLINKFGNVSD